jgi:hypothetical protein
MKWVYQGTNIQYSMFLLRLQSSDRIEHTISRPGKEIECREPRLKPSESHPRTLKLDLVFLSVVHPGISHGDSQERRSSRTLCRIG